MALGVTLKAINIAYKGYKTKFYRVAETKPELLIKNLRDRINNSYEMDGSVRRLKGISPYQNPKILGLYKFLREHPTTSAILTKGSKQYGQLRTEFNQINANLRRGIDRLGPNVDGAKNLATVEDVTKLKNYIGITRPVAKTAELAVEKTGKKITMPAQVLDKNYQLSVKYVDDMHTGVLPKDKTITDLANNFNIDPVTLRRIFDQPNTLRQFKKLKLTKNIDPRKNYKKTLTQAGNIKMLPRELLNKAGDKVKDASPLQGFINRNRRMQEGMKFVDDAGAAQLAQIDQTKFYMNQYFKKNPGAIFQYPKLIKLIEAKVDKKGNLTFPKKSKKELLEKAKSGRLFDIFDKKAIASEDYKIIMQPSNKLIHAGNFNQGQVATITNFFNKTHGSQTLETLTNQDRIKNFLIKHGVEIETGFGPIGAKGIGYQESLKRIGLGNVLARYTGQSRHKTRVELSPEDYPRLPLGQRVKKGVGGKIDPEDIELEMETALSEDGEEISQKDAIDRIIERMFNKFAIGGLVGDDDIGLVGGGSDIGLIGDGLNEIGTIQSMLAGIGAGIIDIPKGAFSLGASLIDLGLGTNHAAKVEKFFDDLTTLDEKAEATLAGNLTRIITNLGIPGAQGFKIGSGLAKQAMVARKANKYFKLNDKKLNARMNDALNAQGRLLTTLGGAAGIGVADAIFVGDPEQVGTIGDMFGSGPTALTPNNENDAAREVMNRMKFGLESSLLLGLVGATGSALKTGIKRANQLEDNNGAIDKILSKFRPRGAKPQKFFDLERAQIGERAADANIAQQIQRRVDKHIDAIFPQIRTAFNKVDTKKRSELMKELNEVLLSGDLKDGTVPGTLRFGGMQKDLVAKAQQRLRDLGASDENIKGIFDAFEDMRLEWGEMFSALGGRMDPTTSSEFVTAFGKNFEEYLGTTYEVFRNKSIIPIANFKPGQEAVDRAVVLFKDAARKAGKELTDEEALHYVNKVVETAGIPKGISTSSEKTAGVMFNAPDFFINKTVLSDLEFKGIVPISKLTDESKKVIEDLLGKVQDPTQTILGGTGRLSLITRRNQFLDALVRNSDDAIAKGDRGFFYDDELQAISQFGVNNVRKINMDPAGRLAAGVDNPVNGKFTSKGIADALEETSKNILGEGALNNIYSNFVLYPKATSQLAKTVLSPITHVRNFISAGAFAAGNGIIPNVEAFRTAFQALQIPGGRMNNEFYQKLLRLGVVNSNVRLGDLQRLLQDVDFGATASSMPGLRRLLQQGSRLKKGAEDFYTAEDDFWKITSFAMERQRYAKAFERAGIAKTADELDELAADIVRNNIPNYDYVNDFIKGLRKFPVGNFVSFPAEIMRTSANILKRSFDDINFVDEATGTAPLRALGFQRLFGFGLTAVALPYGTVEAAKAIYDVSGAEMDALKRFVPEWSKNSTLIPIRGEDGELKYIDFSHANAYDTMIRPISAMINNIRQGADEGTVVQSIFRGMFEATEETLSPFVSEAIWTQAATDIFLRGGRTKDGRRLYTEQTPLGERVYITAAHLVESQLPGSVAQFERLGLSITEKPDEYGREFEFGDEFGGVLGFRAIKVDPVNSMKFKIADFTRGVSNARREFTSPLLKGGPVTPEEIIDRYQVANQQLFKVQREMNKDYYAALTLGSSRSAVDAQFKDRVSNIQLRALKAGTFKPFLPSEGIVKSFADNARRIGQISPYTAAAPTINRLARQYSKVNYMEEGFPFIENPFRRAGETSLPNAVLPSSLPSVVGGQLPNVVTGTGTINTAQKGQVVFGPLDPVFGGN